MDKPTRLADISRTALVEKRYPKERDKGRWNQRLSFIEVAALANLATERMGIDRNFR